MAAASPLVRCRKFSWDGTPMQRRLALAVIGAATATRVPVRQSPRHRYAPTYSTEKRFRR